MDDYSLFVNNIFNLFRESSGITGVKLGWGGITRLLEGAEGTYILGGGGGIS